MLHKGSLEQDDPAMAEAPNHLAECDGDEARDEKVEGGSRLASRPPEAKLVIFTLLMMLEKVPEREGETDGAWAVARACLSKPAASRRDMTRNNNFHNVHLASHASPPTQAYRAAVQSKPQSGRKQDPRLVWNMLPQQRSSDDEACANAERSKLALNHPPPPNSFWPFLRNPNSRPYSA